MGTGVTHSYASHHLSNFCLNNTFLALESSCTLELLCTNWDLYFLPHVLHPMNTTLACRNPVLFLAPT